MKNYPASHLVYPFTKNGETMQDLSIFIPNLGYFL